MFSICCLNPESPSFRKREYVKGESEINFRTSIKMTQYLNPRYTFNGQIGYPREEIDMALSKKANASQTLTRQEIEEIVSAIDSNVVSTSARLQKFIDDVNNGNISTVPIGTTIDGGSTDILIRNDSLAHERPEPLDLGVGELSVNINPLSPAIYLEDSSGEIRKVAGIQFGNTLPNGTAYNSADVSTYPQQRTQGEIFYNPTPGTSHIYDGSTWRILSYGSDVVRPGDLVTSISNLVDIADLQDVTDTVGKSTGDVLSWNGTTYAALPPAVSSVNSSTGVVVLDADDLDDSSTAHKFTDQAAIDKLAGIEANATEDQTGAEIVTLLEGLPSGFRLDAAFIDNLPGSGGNIVSEVNGITGAVVITTANIADTLTQSYVQTIVSNPGELITVNSSGDAVALGVAANDADLSYNVLSSSVEWRKRNVKSLIRENVGATKALAEEYSYLDANGGTCTLQLPATPETGERFYVKNIGSTGTLTAPDLGGLNLLPGDDVSTIWDGTEWQIN